MKKLLLTFTMIFVMSCAGVHAAVVTVDYNGETVVSQRTVERSMIVNCEATGKHDIAVKPLDDVLRSVDGRVEIPLQNVYLNNTHEDVYLRYNDYSELFTGLEMGGIPHQFTAKIRDYGMVPAGIYNLNLEFQATDVSLGNQIATSVFNLQLIVPVKQSITLPARVAQITVSAEDSLKKSKKIANENSPMVNINSNCDWILYINTNDFAKQQGRLYVRTIGASPDVRERLQERVLIEPGREIILAKGKAPCDNQYVSVEYSVENEAGGFMKAGNFENKVKYVLREDRG